MMHETTRHGTGARRLAGAALLALLMAASAATAEPAGAPQQQVAFEAVVASLKAEDPAIRIESLTLLRKAGYLEAAAPVAALLEDAVADVQVEAIATLVSLYLADEAYTRDYAGRIVKQRGATLPLLAFAQGPGGLIPNPAAAQALTSLARAIGSPALAVRFDAIYALGVLAPPAMAAGPLPEADAAIGRLLESARAADPTLRLAATHVVGRLFQAAASGSSQPAFASARQEAGDQLVAGMNDSDPLVRSGSIRALGAMRYERAVQALMDQLGYYKQGEPARELLDALARVAHPSSLGTLAAQLASRDEQMRRLAVEGLARIGSDEALAAAEAGTARDRSAFVKQARAFALATRDDPSALASVVEGFRNVRLAPVAWGYLTELGPPMAAQVAAFAGHKDWRVRAAIAEALGVIGSQASRPAVEGLASDKNRNVAAAARRSLARLTPRPLRAPRVP